MSRNPGQIYELPDGKYGLALSSEQKPEFHDYGKIFYRVFLDAQCTRPDTDSATGKKYVGVRHHTQLKLIGFQD